MRYYFTTSYSSDRDRVSIARFHADIERELRIRAGAVVGGALGSAAGAAPGSPPAHRRPARASQPSPTAATVPALLALLSDEYFQDAERGRDWAIFTERVRDHRLRNGPGRPLLIPVVWRPVTGPAPDSVASTPAWLLAVSQPYADRGVHELLRRRDDDYPRVVEATAIAILEAYQESLPPMPVDQAGAMPPAFGRASTAARNVPGDAGRTGTRPTATRRGVPATVAVSSVAISYAGPDQGWADWIALVLGRRVEHVNKIQLRRGAAEQTAGLISHARTGVDRVVAVLSRNYFATLPGESVDWDRALAGGEGNEASVIGVRIDQDPLPAPVRDIPSIDVSDRAADRTSQLLAAVLESA